MRTANGFYSCFRSRVQKFAHRCVCVWEHEKVQCSARVLYVSSVDRRTMR